MLYMGYAYLGNTHYGMFRAAIWIVSSATLALAVTATPASQDSLSDSAVAPRYSYSDQYPVRRFYSDTSRHLFLDRSMVLEGTPAQVRQLARWLDQIYALPYGRFTVHSVFDSGNTLTIRHSEWALSASGRTRAPVTSRLTNGIGDNAVILFDTRIPDRGSHRVFDTRRNTIEFSALQNLFHELVHARHMVNGTWRYFDSEGQAIQEENVFRKQLAMQRGERSYSLRVGSRGEQIWWPAR